MNKLLEEKNMARYQIQGLNELTGRVIIYARTNCLNEAAILLDEFHGFDYTSKCVLDRLTKQTICWSEKKKKNNG